MIDSMGKGSQPRPKQITREEEDLRWDAAEGKITEATFKRRYNVLLKKGLIRRSGRISTC